MKTLLIDKFQCAKELGNITPKMVLRYVKKRGLPCIYLSRHTIRFDLETIRVWQKNLPALGKTGKQREAEIRRKAAR
jgi:hypothetical protein